MGCASSHLLNHDEDFTTSALGHHIVSLTSTTYGLLTLDPSSKTTPTPTPTPTPVFLSIFPTPVSEPRSEQPHEVINSWELMAGLDSTTESFRFYPQPQSSKPRYTKENLNPKCQENSNLDHKNPIFMNSLASKKALMEELEELSPPSSNLDRKSPIFIDSLASKKALLGELEELCPPNSNLDRKNPIFIDSLASKKALMGELEELCPSNSNLDHKNPIFMNSLASKRALMDELEELCPPKGEDKVVVYTTSLRGVRKTFEACNAVRAVIEGYGVCVSERDISMDEGFREELRELMKGKDRSVLVPPRVFVKGRYVGGVDEVVRTMEEGRLGQLLEGLPRSKAGYVCEGCGGVRFLPCFTCNGSCKMVMDRKEEVGGHRRKRVVVRCGNCNENGLVHCPICS